MESIHTLEVIYRAETTKTEPADAIDHVRDQIALENLAGVILYCSSSYDLDILGPAIKKAFNCPVISCTTSGEIGTCYQKGGIVAVGLSKDYFRVHSYSITNLSTFNAAKALDLSSQALKQIEFTEALDPETAFGFLLIDGLSVQEENVIASLYHAFENIRIVGGSAGDNLNFSNTRVYHNGQFLEDAACFALIESSLDFKVFKLQHFYPSENDLIVTEADPKNRIVYEINGAPAAQEYAEILGLKVDQLDPQVFSMYPVMLQIGDEWYVRAIQKVNPDNSLTFFCAIDTGLPLTIATGRDFVESLQNQVNAIKNDFPELI